MKASATGVTFASRSVQRFVLCAAMAMLTGLSVFAQVKGATKAGSAKPSASPQVPVTMEAGDYSEGRAVVAIAILKGTKPEAINKKTGKPFTGEEMAEILARKLGKAVPPVPREFVKTFVRQTDGDYSRTAYFVDGRLLGKIFAMDEALLMTDMAANTFHAAWGEQLRKQGQK